MKIIFDGWIEPCSKFHLEHDPDKILRVESTVISNMLEGGRKKFISQRYIYKDQPLGEMKRQMFMQHLGDIIKRFGFETIEEVEII